MARFLRTVLRQNVALAAGGVAVERDLGVNPISFLLLTLRYQTLTTLVNPLLANLLGVITNVEIEFKGTAFVRLSLTDLYRMVGALWGKFPITSRINDAVNSSGFITIPIPFSRDPYDMQEALPATRRGDLSIRLTLGAAFTNLTGVTLQLEQVELLDATPEQFLKYTTFARTPTAVGDDDQDLPLGNPIPGALLFSTTVPTGAVFTTTIDQVKLLIDNVENYYSLANWESLHNDFIIRAHPEWDLSAELHRLATAPAYAADDISQGPASVVREHDNYAYLDFDPRKNGQFLLETEGRGRVHLRVTHGVADERRVMPIELIRLPGAAMPATV